MDDSLSLERIAEVIKVADVDIIGIQEADKHYGYRSAFKDQTYELASMLGFYYCYGPNLLKKSSTYKDKTREYGNGILSRFPIDEHKNSPLPSSGEEPRGVLQARIETSEGDLNMMCTHLGLNSGTRLEQMKVLVDITKTCEGPNILAGDFNTEPGNEDMKFLLRHTDYVDHLKSENGYTFPADNPGRRIDYLLVNKYLAVCEQQVVSTEASDHFPIISEVAITL